MATQDDDKAQRGGPADAPAGTGEGSETALQALIRKRQLRADDDTLPLGSDSPDPAAGGAQ